MRRGKEARTRGSWEKESDRNQTKKQTENMMQLMEAPLIVRVTPTPCWFHRLMVGWENGVLGGGIPH